MDSNLDRAAARLAWTQATLGDTQLTLASASADASFRSYWRTHHKGRSWIVMDSPLAQEDPRPWVAIGQRLAAAGLHTPTVHAEDLEQGFLLIEDLGTELYLPALNAETVESLYRDAMTALLRMQRHVSVDGIQPYDDLFLRRELEIMPEWFLERHLGHAIDGDERAVLNAAFEALVNSALEQPQCFVHRDFHSRNLLIVEKNNPGIIDFQGALVGAITYDLASLLRDCYIAWPRERVLGWVADYRQKLRDAQLIDASVDATRFQRWFDFIGLQRHIKVLGIFCRLWYRDGKRGYLDDLPRVYDYVIDVASEYPELREMASLLQRCAGEVDLRHAVSA
jgi:N-acetylmuramate 1-kinase